MKFKPTANEFSQFAQPDAAAATAQTQQPQPQTQTQTQTQQPQINPLTGLPM